MRWFIVSAVAVAAIGAAVPAEARTTMASCQDAIHRLEAVKMRSQMAAEEVGKARAYLDHGNPELCLQHAERARRLELGVSGGSQPRSTYRSSSAVRRGSVYRDPEAGTIDELNRRELQRLQRTQ